MSVNTYMADSRIRRASLMLTTETSPNAKRPGSVGQLSFQAAHSLITAKDFEDWMIFPQISGHRVKGYRMTRNEVSNEQKTQEL